jgi:predicted RNase H-like HicB family nuclease
LPGPKVLSARPETALGPDREAATTVAYCVKIAPHYSGLISAHVPDFPGLVVLGRDHDEAKELARAALELEIDRLISDEAEIPRPKAVGRLMIAARRRG